MPDLRRDGERDQLRKHVDEMHDPLKFNGLLTKNQKEIFVDNCWHYVSELSGSLKLISPAKVIGG